MVVFDILVDGKIELTIHPVNQRRREMYWFMIDQVHWLKGKYGENFRICRRVIH